MYLERTGWKDYDLTQQFNYMCGYKCFLSIRINKFEIKEEKE